MNQALITIKHQSLIKSILNPIKSRKMTVYKLLEKKVCLKIPYKMQLIITEISNFSRNKKWKK